MGNIVYNEEYKCLTRMNGCGEQCMNKSKNKNKVFNKRVNKLIRETSGIQHVFLLTEKEEICFVCAICTAILLHMIVNVSGIIYQRVIHKIVF